MGDVFKALADANRRKILQLLKEKDMNAGEIADYFQMSKPTLSHHLNILKSCGLIIDQKQGQKRVYSLNLSVFQEVMSWFLDVYNGG